MMYFRTPSLDKDYFIFSAVVAVVLIFLSGWNSWQIYKYADRSRKALYLDEALKVQNNLENSLEYLASFLNFVGEQISLEGKNDAVTIAGILKRRSNIDRLDPVFFSASSFDFVTPDGKVIVTRAKGIIANPQIVLPSKRSWMVDAPKNPWQLLCSSPDIGIISGEYVLPCGFGVTDNQGKFLGIISMGMNVNKLSQKIRHALGSVDTNFVVLSQDFQVVAISQENKLNISRAHRANIQINKYVAEDLPLLYADSRRVRQILVNLISNSVKYSRKDTIVTVSALMRDGKIALIVADQGFGMNEEQVAIALTKWGKIANENSGNVDSLGLGLPLTKHLALLHDAEFIIESAINVGTTVTVLFPAGRVKA